MLSGFGRSIDRTLALEHSVCGMISLLHEWMYFARRLDKLTERGGLVARKEFPCFALPSFWGILPLLSPALPRADLFDHATGYATITSLTAPHVWHAQYSHVIVIEFLLSFDAVER